MDSNGIISAKSIGEADISVSDKNNTIKETCHIFVKAREVANLLLKEYILLKNKIQR